MQPEPLPVQLMNGERPWDLVIIGAGPAGSMAAIQLAGRDRNILLVERDKFPRHKVCGCCLNGLALAKLEEAGLNGLPKRLGAMPIRNVHLLTKQQSTSLPMDTGYSVSRKALDSYLVRMAEKRGVHFMPETLARLGGLEGDVRRLELRERSRTRTITSKIVLCADGLGGTSLKDQEGLQPIVSSSARIGLSTILPGLPQSMSDGSLYMAVGRRGYVGLVTLEDGTLNLAAALDTAAIRLAGGPSPAVGAILGEVGLTVPPDLQAAQWKGTPPLTRQRPRLGAERLFIVGDAAGYVEPFTGEGIAWAVAGAQLLAPVAQKAIRSWESSLISDWETAYQQFLGRRQRVCRLLSRSLRHRAVYRSLNHILNWSPGWGMRVMQGINRVY